MGNTTIPAELVAINAIQGTLIADNAITAVHIAQNQVHSVQLAINSVTATQIADGTITSVKIQDGTIATADIADVQITTAKIADDAVTQAKIGTGAVVAASIANGAITSTQMAANSVSTANVQDNAISLAKMAGLTRGSIIYGDSAGDPAYLAAGSSGHVLTSDGTDISWTADTDLFLASSGGTVTGNITISGGILTATNAATTIHRLNSTSNNTRSILRLDSKDSSGNSVEIRMHSLGDGPRGEIFTYTNHDLGFATNNAAPQMILKTTGNVGIGETSPDGKLHIKGGTATGDASHILFENTQGSKVFAIGGGSTGVTNNNLFFRNVTDNTRPMVITDAGNVGIGTNDPGHPLNVVNSGELQAEFSGYSHASAANNSRAASGSIRLGNGAGTTGLLIDYTDQGQTVGLIKNEYVASGSSELRLQSPFLSFYTGTSAAERMRIKSDGKVGINNDDPGTLLSLVHNTSHNNNRLAIFSSDYNYGQIRVGSSTTEASIGFMRSTTLANTENNSPSGGNNTWAIGLGVWGANFGIGSNAILDNVVEWDSSGHMLPGTNNTYDLGSTSKAWRNIYTNDLNLSNMPIEGKDSGGKDYERAGNDVDGTNGSWTIQEGANDLFIINRLNGKKYKFNLTEVVE